jgi:CubicO group peptidase (beta-lactamase class C family)
MKKTTIIYIIIAITIGSCNRQEKKFSIDKPEKVGLSSERLNRIKTVMQSYVDKNKLPGLITMVARQGKIVHFEKYGVMGVDKPMQYNTIFQIASMTKPITSVAIMMLYEEGYFQLDDPVAKYIPEFKNLKVFSYKDKDGIHVVEQIKPMTIENLLTHTSGLGYGWGDTPVDSMYNVVNLFKGTLKDMIQKLAQIPLLYQPGTTWNYSVSTDVLGYLVELISGKPLDVFLKERIFIPLKMKDTYFNVPKEKINRVADIYCFNKNNGMEIILRSDTVIGVGRPATFFSGGGGLYSTASDYMIFSQMLLNKGEYNGERLLGSRTVDFMISNHITNEIMPADDYFGPLLSGYGFGLGFAVRQDNIQSHIIGSIGEYKWLGAYNTYFSIDPKEGLILILMTQFVPTLYYPNFKEFEVLAYQAIVD